MSTISKILKFKFTWRSYQQKFLNHFQEHMEDNHLHLVAPPGSGKTILGLEMLRRVDKVTLVLSPTITIRNQWKSRMEDFFLKDTSFTNYTINIREPKLITFSTYQSLHSLHKKLLAGSDKIDLSKFVAQNNIGTIVLDEAHHLKSEWWKCLYILKEITGLTIISLTATPPYDSSPSEVDKYFKLCGPIDDEIAVPDLIRNGDLCPHQDFIHFSRPDDVQIRFIVKYRERILDFMESLLADTYFKTFLKRHPFYDSTETSLEGIYAAPSFFSAILIFLKASGEVIPFKKLKFLGFEDSKVVFPHLTYEWLQVLLQHLLITQRELYVTNEELLSNLESKLRKIGVLENKKVDFVGGDNLYRSLANSPSKLRSINAIISSEYKTLSTDLRAVVLTDFIRKEFLDYSGKDPKELNKLGVVSIFQYLRTSIPNKEHLGVLTGSLVILHLSAFIEFERRTNKAFFRSAPMDVAPDFYMISSHGKGKNSIVATVTRLFEEGTIKILIGTKSLLGEGWDAPTINTLVLASYVGSFVSSNQMRGRAIRIDPNNGHKTGNVWHLACLDPTIEDGGKDFKKLTRRFEAFSGVSLTDVPYIENGLDRLPVPKFFNPDINLETLNNRMIQAASDRASLQKRWLDAISAGSVLVRELKFPYLDKVPFKETKKMYSVNVVKYLFIEIVGGLCLFLPEFLAKNMGTLMQKGALQFLYFLIAGILIAFAPKTFKALRLYFLFGNVFKKTKKVGEALMKSLSEANYLTTSMESLNLVVEQFDNGTFVCYLKGATEHESTLFVNLLEEVMAPIDNPRYLLVYSSWFKRKWGLRSYYAVPQIFGKKKEDAQLFHKYWKLYVDRSKLLYTRTMKGRKELLKARISHIMYQFKEVSEKAVTWK
ncbi:MAG: DEAD/DEAH box helicase family protein [Bacteroidota bacterium]